MPAVSHSRSFAIPQVIRPRGPAAPLEGTVTVVEPPFTIEQVIRPGGRGSRARKVRIALVSVAQTDAPTTS